MTKATARRLIPVGIGAIAALVAWLALSGGGSSHKAPKGQTRYSSPTATNQQQLTELAKKIGHAIFWTPRPPYPSATLSLLRSSDGGVQVRYLPAGVPLSSPSKSYLVVGTYPLRNAFAVLSRVAKEPGAQVDHLQGGTLGVVRVSVPHSVYLASPRSALLVEVYYPTVSVARGLVRSGAIQALTG